MTTSPIQQLVAGVFRRAWPIALVTVVACAVFTANAVAALVEASYLGPAPRGATRAPPRPPVPESRARADGSALAERNMFCSTCAPGPGPTDSFDPQAILIATSQGFEPLATLRSLASPAEGTWGLDDTVPGVGTIERIGWTSIDVVDARGRRATLSLLAASRGAAGAATPAVAAAAEPWADRIRKIDDHTYEVERSLVRELVSGATRPGGGVRIVPVTENGAMTGLRMLGVKDGGLPAALGIKNGDVVTTLNNKQIQSAQTLIDMYAQIDQLSYVELDGTRGDKPLALSLRLR